MAAATKTQLQAERLAVVADAGYANGEQGRQCEQAGITAIVPRPETVNPQGDYFSREQFAYDRRERRLPLSGRRGFCCED